MLDSIQLLREDITKLKVDAIVNAANKTLLGGGGVDGAIHRAAGSELLEACRLLHGCETGEAKITTGFKLPAKHVIHTVGPVWKGGIYNEADLLSNCYKNAYQLALDYNCQTLAFPNISTGVYGFPKQQAAEIATKTIVELIEKEPLNFVYFVCFDEENFNIYSNLLS